MNGRRFIFTAAEMAVYHGGNRGKADVLPCVLVIDAPDDLLAALRDGRNPATASSTAALPADPSTGAPGDGEADVASVLDGGAGSAGRHDPASSTTDDEGAGSYPDALLTA